MGRVAEVSQRGNGLAGGELDRSFRLVRHGDRGHHPCKRARKRSVQVAAIARAGHTLRSLPVFAPLSKSYKHAIEHL